VAYDARMKHTQMLFVSVSLLTLAGCTRQEGAREVDWAKAALARNPAYEIVATDEKSGVFTVRDTATGAVSTLRVGDLVAAPAPAKVSAPPAAAAPAAASAPAQAANMAAAPDAAAPAVEQTTEEVKATPPPQGVALAEGPGYSISRGEHPAAAPAPPRPQALEGPGYSITPEPATRSATRAAEAVAASNVEKRSDPIICQGDRLMRIDGETLEFTGDALIAEKGCDLYLINVRIRAGGVALIARQARVHIVNSTIGGTQASYEASQGAEIYMARSTLTGVGRRLDTATMNDLGGNDYKLR
jgi:hypothetical protein